MRTHDDRQEDVLITALETKQFQQMIKDVWNGEMDARVLIQYLDEKYALELVEDTHEPREYL